MTSLRELTSDVRALINRCVAKGRPEQDPTRRDALLARIAAFQAEHVAPFARLCRARGAVFDRGPDGWPALPTDVFRYARVALHPAADDVRVFRTSGTTSGARGEHPFADLSLYDHALEAAARRAMFGAAVQGTEREPRFSLVMLAPPPDEVTDSSLSYMLGRFVQHFGDDVAWVLRDGVFDVALLIERLQRGEPTAVLGTSFAFVLLEEALDDEAPFALPATSFAMQTGGFKGKSRELDPSAMRSLVAHRFGLAPHRVVSEYGMTELSSQLYGRALIDGRAHEPERLWVPGWVRVTATDPSSLAPLPTGAEGILRFDDCANVHSCVSIQTADRGVVHDDGSVTLLGRTPGAVPRGCSLAIEESTGRLRS
jgi:hypothetical protein